MTESRIMGRISMRRNKISGSRKPDLFLTEEKTSTYRFLAQTVSPLSGITKGTSGTEDLESPGLGLNLHNHKLQPWGKKFKNQTPSED